MSKCSVTEKDLTDPNKPQQAKKIVLVNLFQNTAFRAVLEIH